MLPNNKVNFGALPKPEFEKTLTTDWHRTYDNSNERVIAKIWEEVLEHKRFNLDDNFFDVGGHSLLISQLAILIETQMAVKVSNIDLFQFPTVRSLARHLSRKTEKPDNSTVNEMARRAALKNQRKKPIIKG
jgi:acyl carrier protein